MIQSLYNVQRTLTETELDARQKQHHTKPEITKGTRSLLDVIRKAVYTMMNV